MRLFVKPRNAVSLHGSQTFSTVGSFVFNLPLPSAVVTLKVWSAGGAMGGGGYTGGNAGYAQLQLLLYSWQTLSIIVGGGGQRNINQYGGGAYLGCGAGGGGASAILLGSVPWVVAGAGGGTGSGYFHHTGTPHGGTNNGVTATSLGQDGKGNQFYGERGASAYGPGGRGWYYYYSGIGGGGGGGGGYLGGSTDQNYANNAGSWDGNGGTSYVAPGLGTSLLLPGSALGPGNMTDTNYIAGVGLGSTTPAQLQAGNGQITIQW